MQHYSTDILTLAQYLAPFSQASRDPTVDALFYLALALAAIERLRQSAAANLEFNGRELITPSIERAYRETLYVRAGLPTDGLDTSVVSRFGRINASDLPHPPD